MWQKKEIKKYVFSRSSKNKSINFGKRILLIFLFLIFATLVSFGLFYLWISFSLPNPDRLLDRDIIQSTKIYDRKGETVLYEVFETERRTMINFSDIPEELIKATIAAEDHYFYEHAGISLRGILRSILVNLKSGNLTAQGGSTITQQLVKAAILTPEKSYIRKLKETILAFQIEQRFNKEQILKMYFNEIPYGSNAYGAEAASQMFFNKKVSEITLDEAVLLAAVVKAPTYYSPHGQNKEKLKARQNYILDQMFNLGFLSAEEKEIAQNEDTVAKIKPRRENIVAPHFIMDVRQQLVERYGERIVEQGGLKVMTTLDIDLQKIAEEAITNHGEKLERYGANNAALVSLNPRTGEILAMVGSKNFFDESIDGYVNVATSARQPGSSFKPIVYAKLFEKGYTPETILFDVVTNFGPDGTGKNYLPLNYDGKERGPISVRQALAGSLNIPAVKALYLSGIDSVIDLAEKFGYTTLKNRSRFGLAIVLGGAEIKLLEHTAAFGVLAQEGQRVEPFYILRVEDANSKVLEENKNFNYREILNPEIARKVNSVLSDNQARAYVFGESNYLNLGNRPVAVKTGTTQSWRDAWTVGYTPSLVCGVWVGNTRNEEMKRGADGSLIAAPIWHEFMNKSLLGKSIEHFNPPIDDLPEKPILRGIVPGEIIVQIDRASGKLATDLTPSSFIIEKKYSGVYHSILHYVNKEDPRGLMPDYPKADPMYERWEEGVQKWASAKGIVFEEPPKEYDDLHILMNQPQVSIISPINNSSLGAGITTVEIFSSAPRGVRRVECLLDNIVLDTSYSPPFNLYLNTTGLPMGYHNLSVRACDDIDNCQIASINVSINYNSSPIIYWISPQQGARLYDQSFPVPLSLSLPNARLNNIKFYYQPSDSHQKKMIAELPSPLARKITVNWLDKPAPGEYELFVEALDVNNSLINSEKILVNIYD